MPEQFLYHQNYTKHLSHEDNNYRYYLLDANMLQGNTKKYEFSLYNDLSGENFEPYELKIELETYA